MSFASATIATFSGKPALRVVFSRFVIVLASGPGTPGAYGRYTSWSRSTSLAGGASGLAAGGEVRTRARTSATGAGGEGQGGEPAQPQVTGAPSQPRGEGVAGVRSDVTADLQHDLGMARERDRARVCSPGAAVHVRAHAPAEAGHRVLAERLAPDGEQAAERRAPLCRAH